MDNRIESKLQATPSPDELLNPSEPSFEGGLSLENKIAGVQKSIRELTAQVELNGGRWEAGDGERVKELEKELEELQKAELAS